MAEYAVMPMEDYRAVCDAIRNKTGSAETIKSGEMADMIEGIKTGVELPVLSNEGAAADLATGKQMIDSAGNVVTGEGTLVKTVYVTIDSMSDEESMVNYIGFRDGKLENMIKNIYGRRVVEIEVANGLLALDCRNGATPEAHQGCRIIADSLDGERGSRELYLLHIFGSGGYARIAIR